MVVLDGITVVVEVIEVVVVLTAVVVVTFGSVVGVVVLVVDAGIVVVTHVPTAVQRSPTLLRNAPATTLVVAPAHTSPGLLPPVHLAELFSTLPTFAPAALQQITAPLRPQIDVIASALRVRLHTLAPASAPVFLSKAFLTHAMKRPFVAKEAQGQAVSSCTRASAQLCALAVRTGATTINSISAPPISMSMAAFLTTLGRDGARAAPQAGRRVRNEPPLA
ncbi:MAG TPA: hypothetical protein VGR62_19115 [Candidatus Binatia bacterium]|nr:hypothetical protein [Candidatus Binatia bacterium]